MEPGDYYYNKKEWADALKEQAEKEGYFSRVYDESSPGRSYFRVAVSILEGTPRFSGMSTGKGNIGLELGGENASKLESLPKWLQKMIIEVPDTDNCDLINYWKKHGDYMVYLEGWNDGCLSGTGHIPMYAGEWEKKIDYIKELTPSILMGNPSRTDLPNVVKKWKGNNDLKLVSGGFIENEDYPEYLYGVTYGVYKLVPEMVSEIKENEIRKLPDRSQCMRVTPPKYPSAGQLVE
jgi:hypothetical protein